jgi:TonB-dependent SusC/RagA subfamily outer membrane receptor
MKILFKRSIFLLLLFAVTATFAQERTVSGIVVDNEDGKPLPGVTVLVKGTNTGTQSNTEGRFTIQVSGQNKQLEFRYLGLITQTVALGSKTTLRVTMKSDATQLNELMVVGYGSQKKSDFTGSTSSIKGEDIRNLSTQRVDQALQGQATGVMVMNTDAAPGGNTVIRVRGMNSINGGNSALVVIDGLQGGNLNSLNPNDIESVEVLKDASATAIYGSQGANGVILVTTKIGKKGKPVVSYSYSGGEQKLSNRLDLMSAGDYARTINANTLTQNGNGVYAHTNIFRDQYSRI